MMSLFFIFKIVHRLSTFHDSLCLARCGTLIWRLRWRANKGLELRAWVASELRSVVVLILNISSFRKRTLHKPFFLVRKSFIKKKKT